MITSAQLDTVSPLTNRQLAFVTGGRLALSIAYRMLYPLLPFLALRFGVSLQTVTMLVSVQVAASLTSLLGGRLVDTHGHRAAMSGGLTLCCLGTTLCALAPTFGLFLVGYGLIGLAGALYQPAAQAYLSARTPYARRGWVLGMYETSWACAALFGIAPLMYVVQTTGDSTPIFWLLLGAGLSSLAVCCRRGRGGAFLVALLLFRASAPRFLAVGPAYAKRGGGACTQGTYSSSLTATRRAGASGRASCRARRPCARVPL